MKTLACEKREDGSLDIANPSIVDSENIPVGLFLTDPQKIYNEFGYEVEKPQPQPQEPTESDRLEALEMLMVDILGGGF